MTAGYIYEDREELYKAVAVKCATELNRDVYERGMASIVVPGGTTPAPVFEKLSQIPLPWDKVSIVPSDERWIATDHQQSNQYLIEQRLMINHASAAQLIGLKNDAETAEEGEVQTELALEQIELPFTVTVLGMGNDGHFASLFPGCPKIQEALDLNQQKKCMAINAESNPAAGEFTQRMSLTMASLINSKLIIILITGQRKLDLIREADQGLEIFESPISALLAQTQTPIEIYWSE